MIRKEWIPIYYWAGASNRSWPISQSCRLALESIDENGGELGAPPEDA
jgi:hypothetical protein